MLQSIFLVVLSINSIASLNTTYYITPDQNTPCPLLYDNCTTISTFAASLDTKYTINANISLVFHQGNHTLRSNMSIVDIILFVMSSEDNMGLKSNLTCDVSASMLFSSVSYVYIHNLNFIGCTELKVHNVKNFVMDSISNQGIWTILGSAIIASNSSISLIKSSFSNFYGSLWSINCKVVNTVNQCSEKNQTSVGGVMIALNSTVNILDSNFQNNTAALGGALYIDTANLVIIWSSSFVNHITPCKEVCHGGVIFVDSSFISVNDCTFLNNRVFHRTINVTKGGVIRSYESTVLINSSVFSLNFAYNGAVIESRGSTVNFYWTNFTQNTAKLNGGVGLFKSSNISIQYCRLYGNTAVEKAGGAFYLDRSNMSIYNSHFESNRAYNLGGVARISKSTIYINTTYFVTNEVSSRGGVLYTSNMKSIILERCTFRGNNARSGGAISVNKGSTLHMKVSNSYTENSAYYGGAIQVQFSSLTCNGKLTFIHNNASWGVFAFLHSSGNISGKVSFRDNIGSLLSFDSDISASGKLVLQGNKPEEQSIKHPGVHEGGAITSILSTLILKGNVKIFKNSALNGGGIMATSSRVEISGIFNLSNNYALAGGGGLYLYHSQVIVSQGHVSIVNNKALDKGGGIHDIGSSLIVVTRNKENSAVYFLSNKAEIGGGICMEASSKLYTTTDSQAIYFVKNRADYGGAIYVSDETNKGACSSSQQTLSSTSDSDCFIQSLLYNAYSTESNKTKSIESLLNFTGNSANISGAVLYGGLLDRCTIDLFDSKAYVKVLYSSQTNFIQDILNHTTSSAVKICFCKDGHSDVDCSFQPEPIKVMKGRVFTLHVAAVDHVNHSLNNAIIHSYLSHKNSRIGKGLKTQSTNTTNCTALKFIAYTTLDNETMIMYPEGPCKDAEKSRRSVEIVFLPCKCPIGFEPSTNEEFQYTCKCECHSQIRNIASQCDASTSLIHRKGNFWLTAFNNSNFFTFAHCPLDYCLPSTVDVRINFTQPNGTDAQCNHGRSGILCSICRPDLSLSLGSSRCLFCPKYWPALLIVITLAAIIIGIVLIAIIFILNLTVAFGTMNGIVFYANVIAANRTIFLPFQKPNLLTVLLAWLNLDFGFDVCFYKGMDAYAKIWIELLFSIYIIGLVVLVIIICKHFDRFSSLIGKKNPVATLATLILFSYAKLLQSIITVASFVVLNYPNHVSEIVWQPDATVKYVRGKHVPLFMIAIIVLLIGVSYTFLLFTWQWLQKYSEMKMLRWVKNTKVSSFIDAYHAPYVPRKRYWTGLLLIARVVIYTETAVNVSGEPTVNLFTVIVVVTFLFLLKSNTIYKKWPTDFLETSLYANLVLFSAGKLYILKYDQQSQLLLASISCGITILMLACVLLYHFCTKTSILSKCFNGLQQIRLARKIQENQNLFSLDEETEHLQRYSPFPDITFSEVSVSKSHKLEQEDSQSVTDTSN